jgi:glycosyltransferase involved in cell wall biosynthesis
MRILIAQDALHAEGGVESYLGSVVPGLRARGHSIGLLYVQRRGAPRIAGVDGPYVAVEPAAMEDGFAILRAWSPDVCFSNNMASLPIESRALDEWPVVKFMHGYAGTCISGLKTHTSPRPAACHRTFGPACAFLYAPRHCGQLTPGALVGGYRWARQQRRLFTRYASIIVASEHMKREYERHGAPPDRVVMLPLFPSDSAPRAADPAGDSVLFLGRMTELKGGDILIRAVSRAAARLKRSISLVLAGDGPQRGAWERLASREGVNASFPGWLGETQRAEALSRAAVLAVPSVWPEPFGLVGLEAAAMGVPAVAFDTGGIRQWLRDGVSGMLVSPSSGEAGLAIALAQILDDPQHRARLSAGATVAAQEMSASSHLTGLESVLDMAVQRRASTAVASGPAQ